MARTNALRSMSIPLMLLFLAACGGGGDDDLETLELGATKAREGTVNLLGATVANFLNFGDNSSNAGIRAVVSFSLAPIPPGATVESATLLIEQEDTGFGTPYTDLGPLLVDHVDLGADVDSADFDGGTITSNLGAISTTAGNGTRSLDVTAAVLADLAAPRTRSEFRLRFTLVTNNDNAQDTLRVVQTDTLDGKQVPVLVLTVRP